MPHRGGSISCLYSCKDDAWITYFQDKQTLYSNRGCSVWSGPSQSDVLVTQNCTVKCWQLAVSLSKITTSLLLCQQGSFVCIKQKSHSFSILKIKYEKKYSVCINTWDLYNLLPSTETNDNLSFPRRLFPNIFKN